MSKFTYDDIVRVKPTVKAWLDVPGFRKSGPRIGERAWVFAVRENQARAPFLPGTIYGVEFEDGDALEVHEDDLELIEPAI
jgi:hypothetical protein